MKKEKYNITGMSCSACSSRVQKAMDHLEGIEKAEVNLLTNSMTVIYDENKLKSEAIVSAVEKSGYGAVLADDVQESAGYTVEKNQRKNIAEEQMAEMKRRLIISFCFLIPLMWVAMGHMIGLPLPAFLCGTENAVSFALTQFLLCLPVVIVNQKYYTRGFKSLFNRAPNMDSLIAVGSGAALIYGIIVIYIISHALGAGQLDIVAQYHHELYFESAAMILTLVTLGKYFEAKAKGKTGEAIEKLINLSPKTAIVLRDGKEVTVQAAAVRPGEIVVIRPGTGIPVDGTILKGQTAVDEAAVTGESIPAEKSEGDPVIAATMNTTGYIEVRAEKIGEDTAFAKIIQLVEEASASKAPIARMADKIAGIFVPAVMGIALITAVIWLLAGASVSFTLTTAISVLVISCPCALGLATPVSIMVGTGKGAENGILIKNGEALETTCKIDTVVFDKTGTITTGHPVVRGIRVLKRDWTEEKLLACTAALESGSEHPLAKAIAAFAVSRGIVYSKPEKLEALSGLGVYGVLDGKSYYAGSLKMAATYCRPQLTEDAWLEAETNVSQFSEIGQTAILLFTDQTIFGIIAVEDAIKSTSIDAVRDLKNQHIHTVMLTGDHIRAAKAIANQADIDEVIAGVLPAEKARAIQKLQDSGQFAAMVGDGINDAPALVTADIGMAIGAGTDVAIESADVILMHNDLRDVSAAIRLSKAVIRNIKQNLFWALCYNSICIPVAAGILYPAFGIRLTPMIGALCMSLSSVCVVSNALRLKTVKLKPQASKPEENFKTDPEINQMIEEEKPMSKTIKIEGMMCPHCVAHVEKALNAVEEVQSVVVNLEDGTAVIEGNVTDEILTGAITDAGYQVIEIV